MVRYIGLILLGDPGYEIGNSYSTRCSIKTTSFSAYNNNNNNNTSICKAHNVSIRAESELNE